jgi:Carboxypeptidase regulatory-like domain
MHRRNPLPVLFVLIVAGAVMATAFAQSATATLSGAVVDEAGAVVAGAKIELTNLGAVLKRAATTSGEGYFSFPLLPPGTYTLQALREGFASVEIKNIVLNVNDQQDSNEGRAGRRNGQRGGKRHAH